MLNKLKLIKKLNTLFSLKDLYFLRKSKNTKKEIKLYLKPLKKFIYIRPNDSDLKVCEQIFINKEYESKLIKKPRLIIDAGANIGISALWFNKKYPNAKIVCLEPNTQNFELLVKNTCGIEKIKPLNLGLWSTNTKIQEKTPCVESWGFQFKKTKKKLGVKTITINQIIKKYGKIDVFKIDIEGSEKNVFVNADPRCLNKICLFIIELHDRFISGCSKAFYSFLGKKIKIQEINGENLFCKLR